MNPEDGKIIKALEDKLILMGFQATSLVVDEVNQAQIVISKLTSILNTVDFKFSEVPVLLELLKSTNESIPSMMDSVRKLLNLLPVNLTEQENKLIKLFRIASSSDKAKISSILLPYSTMKLNLGKEEKETVKNLAGKYYD